MKMKTTLLTLMCLVGFALSSNAQQKHLTFNAVAQNVDGLPKDIAGTMINPDGTEAAGATVIGRDIANNDWDIVGLSEDFNFHDELIAPLNNLYFIGTHGGKVSTTINHTDGLGFLLAKRAGSSFTGETSVTFEAEAGGVTDDGDHGYDELVDKGFRYYEVTLGDGFVVDVYVLHMDAGSRTEDIDARTSQLQQLVTYIKANTHNRPILIIGDTNCRYTRDTLKEDVINSINHSGKMTIKDAWIELVRGGEYPVKGSEPLMTHQYGQRKGEVVDKILYINIEGAPLQLSANTYERPSTLEGLTDHSPVLVNFTLTNTTVADETDETLESRWTVPDISSQLSTIQGCQMATGGKKFYVRNLSSNKYLKSGGIWGTQATEGSAGMPVSFTLSNGKYRINTVGNRSMTAETTPYMDNSGDNYGWTFEQVEGSEYQYYIMCDAGALTSTGEAANVVKCTPLDRTNTKQKWVLLDDEQMKAEMLRTTTAFDCTPLVKAADFDYLDFPRTENDNADNMANWGAGNGFVNACDRDGGATTYASCTYFSGTEEKVISQTLTDMPQGTYMLTCEGFYRFTFMGKPTLKPFDDMQLRDAELNVTIDMNGTSASFLNKTDVNIGSNQAALFEKNDNYQQKVSSTLDTRSSITITITKPKATDADYSIYEEDHASWICIDNVMLVYQGSGEIENDPTLEYRVIVANKINATWAKVLATDNEVLKNNYDIATVLYRYNNGYVTTEGEANILCALIDDAYNAAVIASNKALVDNATENGDVSSVIINPGFETGDFTGWNVNLVGDTKVTDDPNIATSNMGGSYLFNTWNGDGAAASNIQQSITGLKNGLYELKAMVTSHPGKVVFLTGNNAHSGVTATDNGKFVEATLQFLVDDGIATIGAVGGTPLDAASVVYTDFIYFMPTSGGYFKADDFSLTYICNSAYGRLKLAMDKAKEIAAGFDYFGKQAFDISAYEAMFDNKQLATDGTAEAHEVYLALTKAAKAQKTLNADMTYAITNPNFEDGNWNGWTVTTADETVVSSEARFATVGYDGSYLLNSWRASTYDEATNTWSPIVDVKPISQTVTGIPNGKYRLTARMTSDAGHTLFVSGNGTAATPLTAKAARMDLVSTEFEVTDGTATILAGGTNAAGEVDAVNGGYWFKADDFHLTYLGREIVLEETTKTLYASGYYTKVTFPRVIPTGKWSTFVVPFSIPVPDGLTVKKFVGDDFDGAFVNLYFEDATIIEPGVPYMVKPTGGTTISFPAMDNIDIDMTEPVLELPNSTIHGNYIYQGVPQGTYFIYNNQYKYAADDTNKIKAFRVYIDTSKASNGAEAKGVRYVFGWDGDGTTGIDGVDDAESAKVVAVFGVDGRRLDALQNGINIVKMSNGTTKKVFVKER